MSDPQPQPGKSRPPRAEPLQPDHPGRGDAAEAETDAGGTSVPDAPFADDESSDSAHRQRDRSDAALKNVREGYR